jgi:hypothetical protein
MNEHVAPSAYPLRVEGELDDLLSLAKSFCKRLRASTKGMKR